MKSKDWTFEQVTDIVRMRHSLDVIFESENALYMTGDMFRGESMIGLWEKQKPRLYHNRFDGRNTSFKSAFNEDGELEEDFTYDVPWCIDLCSGEMELPTLGLKFTLEEWAVM